MADENWQQVREIFDDALRRRPAERRKFVHDACGKDRTLLTEVESLLSSLNSADGFMETPAVATVAGVIEAESKRLEAGKCFGHYEIIEQIGAGGMGEVYLAEDKKLDRKVAVKILNEKFSQDESNLNRFIREAKAASALDHPNILVIHEIGEAEGTYYSVSEFIKGKTLREILTEKSLKLSEILEISIQIANALAAAHETHLIHRDIKPENIMVRPDGVLKVLDFGLAKLVEQKNESVFGLENETTRQNQTAKGVIMGTVNYMSPEQAKGENVDERTDIFSFGIVLYEMVAGRTPFVGDSISETFANLIHVEPQPLSHFLKDIPDKLQLIISKMLYKKRDERYQTMKELLLDLQDLRFAAPAALTKRENTPQVESKKNRMVWLLTAICGTILLFGAFFLWQNLRTDLRFEKVEFKALTMSGDIRDAAISPDGKLLAYAKNENGKQSLWIRQTQFRESELRLTEPLAEVSLWGLKFTPDGNKIYFLLKPKNNSIKQVYAVSILGGKPILILDDIDSPPTFAPDGQHFAFIRANLKTGITTLFIAGSDGSAARELTERVPPLSFRNRPLAWSPDGKKIVCVVYDRILLSGNQIVEIEAETGRENVVTDQVWNNIYAVEWTKDGAGLIFAASEMQKPLESQIWFLPYPNGTPRRLTNDMVNYGNLSVASESGEIIIRQEKIENQVWLVDTKSSKSASSPRRITPNISDGVHGLAWLPDNHLIYSSDINGSNSLQKMSVEDSSSVTLTTGDYVFSQPCAASDGRYVIFVSTQGKRYHLWRVDTNGKNIKQLTSANVEYPTCSPNGDRIFYTTVIDGKVSLWEISIDGGTPRLISEKIIGFAQISPDGTRIACYYRAGAKSVWQIAILTVDDARVRQILDLPKTVALNSPFVWSTEGDALIFIDTREGIANLWRYPLDGQASNQITTLTDESLPIINTFAVSPDGSQIALTRARKTSDIVQIIGESPPTAR